jgi:ABC-type sugar transport system substrate-binding protein
VCYDENNEEIRIKLADIVEAKYDLIVFSPPNPPTIQEKIEEFRKAEEEAFVNSKDVSSPEEPGKTSPQ